MKKLDELSRAHHEPTLKKYRADAARVLTTQPQLKTRYLGTHFQKDPEYPEADRKMANASRGIPRANDRLDKLAAGKVMIKEKPVAEGSDERARRADWTRADKKFNKWERLAGFGAPRAEPETESQRTMTKYLRDKKGFSWKSRVNESKDEESAENQRLIAAHQDKITKLPAGAKSEGVKYKPAYDMSFRSSKGKGGPKRKVSLAGSSWSSLNTRKYGTVDAPKLSEAEGSAGWSDPDSVGRKRTIKQFSTPAHPSEPEHAQGVTKPAMGAKTVYTNPDTGGGSGDRKFASAKASWGARSTGAGYEHPHVTAARDRLSDFIGANKHVVTDKHAEALHRGLNKAINGSVTHRQASTPDRPVPRSSTGAPVKAIVHKPGEGSAPHRANVYVSGAIAGLKSSNELRSNAIKSNLRAPEHFSKPEKPDNSSTMKKYELHPAVSDVVRGINRDKMAGKGPVKLSRESVFTDLEVYDAIVGSLENVFLHEQLMNEVSREKLERYEKAGFESMAKANTKPRDYNTLRKRQAGLGVSFGKIIKAPDTRVHATEADQIDAMPSDENKAPKKLRKLREFDGFGGTGGPDLAQPLLGDNEPGQHERDEEMARAHARTVANKSLHLQMIGGGEKFYRDPEVQQNLKRARDALNNVHDMRLFHAKHMVDEGGLPGDSGERSLTPSSSPGNQLPDYNDDNHVGANV